MSEQKKEKPEWIKLEQGIRARKHKVLSLKQVCMSSETTQQKLCQATLIHTKQLKMVIDTLDSQICQAKVTLQITCQSAKLRGKDVGAKEREA